MVLGEDSTKGDKESRGKGRTEREQRWGAKEVEILRDVGNREGLGERASREGTGCRLQPRAGEV